TAEGNPSGGNRLRGLYNIILKSIGAAQKKHPEIRLDRVIEYGEPMREAGFYFMDSPGNDLESVAGQVASGSTLIIFTTGNGSITNFPFVPTVKVVTTTTRYELLPQEMDFNAGFYLDGIPLEELGARLFEKCRAAASGEKTAGEGAGHYQVSIWRDWRQSGDCDLTQLLSRPAPKGAAVPLKLVVGNASPDVGEGIERWKEQVANSCPSVGLVLPTSLCSGQIAAMAARRLNELSRPIEGFQRFISLTHTEGCGVSRGANMELYTRTLLGYLRHPLVRRGLLLEHGCETTHNQYFRRELEKRNLDPGHFGWASVQLDGGIEPVLKRIEEWFCRVGTSPSSDSLPTTDAGVIRVGIVVSDQASPQGKSLVADLALLLLDSGGQVIIPEHSPLLQKAFLGQYLQADQPGPTIAYGEAAQGRGLHLMESPTHHRVETLSGLGACGARVLLALEGPYPGQGHPLVPTVRVAWYDQIRPEMSDDLDLLLDNGESMIVQMVELLRQSDAGVYQTKSERQSDVDFQCTRGLLGVSM
ncbi:MAG TPA: UxaA family hydrolase, partial [Acidobacteriota bacterium]|nr:UxaA family hydrolase [Acidobacteriota bacterium]